MGADSLCIKDMAGLLTPYAATELVTALKQGTKLPIDLHTHYTPGVLRTFRVVAFTVAEPVAAYTEDSPDIIVPV